MKIRIMSFLLAALLLLSGCSAGQPAASGKKYQASFLDLFDTVTVMVGYAEREEAFLEKAEALREELTVYHQLYDIYHDYPHMNNLKTVNDNAGKSPVKVDEKIIDLLLLCKELYAETDGRVNIAMGSVLSLWHDARSAGAEDPASAELPDGELLQAAAEHTDFEKILIDGENSTVFLTDPRMRLDVGAIAKGYAVERVCETAPEGILISVGGNVCSTGPRPDGSDWVVGLQDPDMSEAYLHTLRLSRGAVVTSGDYQRYYTVNGKKYHHIIDPHTLMPAEYWSAVTVICENSGIADALSTAAFLMPKEEGEALLKKYGAEAIWIDENGNEYYSEGFSDYMRT